MSRIISSPKFVLFICLLSSINSALGESIKLNIPNLDFVIATHKTINKKQVQGIHFFKLYCALDSCKLEQLSLNECETINSIYGFSPKVISWSTESDTLSILPISKKRIEVTVFQGTHHQLPATMEIEFNPAMPFSKKVLKFNTKNFIDLNQFPKLIITEYHIVNGQMPTEKIECPAFIPQ